MKNNLRSDKMSERIIKIGSKDFSESTIIMALHEHCNFTPELKDVPVLRTGKHQDLEGYRIFVKIKNKSFLRELTERVGVVFTLVIDQDGEAVTAWDLIEDAKRIENAYEGVEEI